MSYLAGLPTQQQVVSRLLFAFPQLSEAKLFYYVIRSDVYTTEAIANDIIAVLGDPYIVMDGHTVSILVDEDKLLPTLSEVLDSFD